MSLARPLTLILLALPGCAGVDTGLGPAGWAWPFAPGGASHGQPGAGVAGRGYAQFSFDWQLEGDPEIMPVQVFDDGASMWLQFAPDGAWPAVFDAGDAGWRPLSYRREPPYMILDGVHAELALRGGSLRGSIRRAGGAGVSAAAPEALPAPLVVAADTPMMRQGVPGMPSVPVSTVAPHAYVEADAPILPGTMPMAAPAAEATAAVVPGTAVGASRDVDVSPPGTVARAVESAGASPSPAAEFLGAPIGHFAVSPADVTMRQALERWASQSSWTFSAEHWAVDVDIPVVGRASFQTDFKSAVRELLAATEMGDRPLQPCFYSNRVLRVVSYAQACDRRGGMGALS